MLRHMSALVLCAGLALEGCASAGGQRIASAPAAGVDRSVLADYAQRLPAGSRVRVERTDGTSVRGTLMKATSDAIVVQKNTRVPEPPIDVPLSAISRLTLDQTSSLGKNIAIGVATGVGATFGLLFLVAALMSG
ncbi:MAG TPA: hypothetical protein VL225_18550 [Vicinamibacterales bacterium]|nr:hypothetical protein [Vicinamibacterales bacterium]